MVSAAISLQGIQQHKDAIQAQLDFRSRGSEDNLYRLS
uniref:Uncharacterized protein n=1 Tax=Arundo donax TaxID=35708 RepID=A0A0A9H706_ARUDO